MQVEMPEMEMGEHPPGDWATTESSLQKKAGTGLSTSETPLLLVWVILSLLNSQMSFRFVNQVSQYSVLLNSLLPGWQFILFMMTLLGGKLIQGKLGRSQFEFLSLSAGSTAWRILSKRSTLPYLQI